MTDYERLGALVADCDDDTELIDILTPVIAVMAKARRTQLLKSNPIRDPRRYDHCPGCGGDVERGWRHTCQAGQPEPQLIAVIPDEAQRAAWEHRREMVHRDNELRARSLEQQQEQAGKRLADLEAAAETPTGPQVIEIAVTDDESAGGISGVFSVRTDDQGSTS
jgi:hypothetical protein